MDVEAQTGEEGCNGNDMMQGKIGGSGLMTQRAPRVESIDHKVGAAPWCLNIPGAFCPKLLWITLAARMCPLKQCGISMSVDVQSECCSFIHKPLTQSKDNSAEVL